MLSRAEELFADIQLENQTSRGSGESDAKVIIQDVASYLSLAFEFCKLFSQDSVERRQMFARTYRKIGHLTMRDLRWFIEGVSVAENRYHIREASIRNFLHQTATWIED